MGLWDLCGYFTRFDSDLFDMFAIGFGRGFYWSGIFGVEIQQGRSVKLKNLEYLPKWWLIGKKQWLKDISPGLKPYQLEIIK